MNRPSLIISFENFWSALFSSPIHLDSLLSKQPKESKPWIAEVAHAFLLRPVSMLKAYEVDFEKNEPWCLSLEEIAQWSAPVNLFSRIVDSGWMPGRKFALEESGWKQDLPPEMLEAINNDWVSRALLDPAPLSLRVRRKFHPKEFSPVFEDWAEIQHISPQALSFKNRVKVMHTEEFLRGDYEIQDEGSQILSFFALWPKEFAHFLHEKPGKAVPVQKMTELPPMVSPSFKIIDACAGAGGKSLAMADAVQGKARVFSYDISERKLQSLKKRAQRSDLRNIQTRKVTEGAEEQELKGFFKTADRVLVDAPCSGWGVLRRNPDMKWRQTFDYLERVPEIQLGLLKSYSKLVKPGGFLTYGLCTFRKEETTDVVERFSSENPQFKKGPGGYLGPDFCDGFFMQNWVREKS